MMHDRREVYIAGRWARPSSNAVIEVENPTTETMIARIPRGSTADVDAAVAAARAAFPSWSQTTPDERVALLTRLRDRLTERNSELAETITNEIGCPIKISTRIQAGLPATIVGSYAEILRRYAFEDQIDNSIISREPIGVIGAITPWNYPLHQIICKLAPALAAGCTVVLKPSEIAPLTAYMLFDVLDEIGVPAGVVNLVPGYGPEVGEAIAKHPDVDAVSFTGSQRAGVRVAELAATTIKRVTLELGGKSANVILPDADLDKAIRVGVGTAYLNGGQTCTAWTRMLVHSDQYDEVVERVADLASTFQPGDPLLPTTKLGPMVSVVQRDRVRGLIDTAVSEGARVVTGGSKQPRGFDRGYFVAPTVLADVDPNSTVAQEEVFGPVLSVLRYTDEADALEIANNSRYGLSGAVWSVDSDRAVAFARRVRSGQIDVNGGQYNPLAPFGGYKQSGIGRELGTAGLEEYLETKAIQL